MENMQLDMEVTPFVVALTGVVCMLIFSAIGSVVGSAKAASSAAVVANRGTDIITKAYLPVLFASAGFMYALIVTFFSLRELKVDMPVESAGRVFTSCIIYGVGGLFSGIAIGEANKNGIVRLSENRKVFLSLLIVNSTIEMVAVFSLICSVMILLVGK
ncbi:V-type H+-transporting ATPase 16kDa proteolipid subunit [Nematocida sp. AWRm78]|nr:V-type H+-transporting ATPase 16kDa proteolipid subunit [Nematocida sp. AWRm79]KAI5182522.1 V-type H+-transporting ATPase 16kDa proteolipid subunit [Nematocida sp. AWRm78]